MSKSMQAKNVMSGTHGELWIDDDYISEVTEFKAETKATKAAVTMVKHSAPGQKVLGYTCTGSLKLHKVSSYMIRKFAESIQNCTTVTCDVVAKLDDPDAWGAERVALHGVVFDSVTLMAFTAGKLGEESYNFSFESFDLLDTVDHE